MIRSFLYDL